MCGFVGVVRTGGRVVLREEIAALLPFVARRGPDGSGVVVDGELGLASSRLAIQGGREGDQPLRSEDGRFVLAYNGELFASHRRRLRGLLRDEGAGEVRATSDTELLLAWLSHHLAARRAGDPVPPAALAALEGGMYAFALLDLRTREAILHTDGGIKPLHVLERPELGETWFGSTIAPLLAAAGGRRALDPDALCDRLVAPEGRTPLVAGLRLAEVGRRVGVIRAADAGKVRYAAPPDSGSGTGPAPDLDQVREAFSDAAREAAEMIGPASLFLSGGLDSAGVAAWCERKDILAITGRFAPLGGPYDESDGAAAVTASLGLRHEIVTLSDRDLLLDMRDVVAALEEPSGGPGSLAMHRVAQRARAHGRMALSGTGGDERFGGYARVALALGREGAWTKGYEQLAARMAPAGADPRSRWLAAVDRSDDLLPWLAPDFAATLRIDAARQRARAWLFGPGGAADEPTPARALVRAEVSTSLHMLLRVEDRVTMSLGLESRPVPCLGRLPSIAARLPEGDLVGPDGEGKRALRAALSGRIPETVRTDRRKRGFPTPFHRAATGAGRDVALSFLNDRRFRERGWWNVKRCRGLLDEDRPGHDRALYTILSYELWARAFLDGDALSPSAEPRP